MNNVSPWLMPEDRARQAKLFLTRFIVGLSVFWLIVAALILIDLLVNGVPGTAQQHIPADFNRSAAEWFYYRGSSIEAFHAALFLLALMFVNWVLALSALKIVNEMCAGKKPRLVTDPRWRTGMQWFFYIVCAAIAISCVAVKRHIAANPHQWPQF